jgi:hypothetical protein
MGAKGTTKKPFWAKARREYECFNCSGAIAEGEDVLIFQPISIHTWALDHPADARTRWDFACGECGEWEVQKPIKEKQNVSQSQVQGAAI